MCNNTLYLPKQNAIQRTESTKSKQRTHNNIKHKTHTIHIYIQKTKHTNKHTTTHTT